jgi:hypothetical protein
MDDNGEIAKVRGVGGRGGEVEVSVSVTCEYGGKEVIGNWRLTSLRMIAQ